MPAERQTVHEREFAVGERLGHPVGDDHAAERRVSGRHALRERDHVGLEPVPDGAEPLADTAEAGDHLVRDEQDAVRVAQRAYALPVASRRGEATAGVLHRLRDHHRDRLGALEDDRVFQLGEQGGAERVLIVTERMPVGVGVADEVRRDGGRCERCAGVDQAGERERTQRCAVVRDPARDDLVPQRLAVVCVPLPGQLVGGLVGVAAAGGEEDPVEVAGSEFGQLRRESDRAGVGDEPVRHEHERRELLLCGRTDLRAVVVSEVRAEQAGQSVDEPAAVRVEEVTTLSAYVDRDVAVCKLGHVREVQHEVFSRVSLQISDVERHEKRLLSGRDKILNSRSGFNLTTNALVREPRDRDGVPARRTLATAGSCADRAGRDRAARPEEPGRPSVRPAGSSLRRGRRSGTRPRSGPAR